MAFLVGVIVWVAFSRIYTVVTGVADIAHYYEAAQRVLEAATWEARLRAALVWAPLHPLLLASITQWFGAEWTYLLNPIFIFGMLCGMGAWGWRAMRDYRCGPLTALAGAMILLFGYDQSAHSVLYPYREAPSFFFVYAAMFSTLLAFSDGRMPRRIWLFVAGCGYVLAAAVREPAILALPGAVAYVLAQPRKTIANRASDVMALAAPILLALIILAWVFVSTGIIGSQQFAGWRAMSGGTSFAAWLGMYWAYLKWLFHLLGPWGSAISVVGLVWMARRNRAAVYGLVLSLLGTVALYASFAIYSRYALSAAIFLVPFLGAGLRAIVWSAGRLLGKSRKWPESLAYGIGVGLLMAYGLFQSAHLAPWGGVSRHQIRAFEQVLLANKEPTEQVLTDPRSRLLNETLDVYLGLNPVSYFDGWGGSKAILGFLFIQPANPEAILRAKVKTAPVSMEAEILKYADMESLRDAADRPLILSLGAGEYTIYRVRPWSQHRVEQGLSSADVGWGLLWLDFQQSDAEAVREVQVRNEAGDILRQWSVGQGNGLVPFAVGSKLAETPLRLIATSSSPLPAQLLARPTRSPDGPYFGLGMGRRPSIEQWIVPPPIFTPQQKWAAILENSARFAVPAPRGAPEDSCVLSVWLEPRFHSDQSVVFHYRVDGAEATTVTNRLDQGWIHHEIPLRLRAGAETCQMDLAVDAPKDWGNFFKVIGLGSYIKPSE